MKELILKCMGVLSEHAFDTPPVRIRFDIPETSNQAFLSIEAYAIDRSKRCIVVAANRKGTDMLINHFYPAGTAEEIKAYLDRGDPSEILESVESLSKSVDDKW